MPDRFWAAVLARPSRLQPAYLDLEVIRWPTPFPKT